MKLRGKTATNKQRFQCLECHGSYLWRIPRNKSYREQHWFKLWVLESYSIRQLCKLSGHSKSKLERIKDTWLGQSPPDERDYDFCQYLLFDGTYFHKRGCLILLMDTPTSKVIRYAYVPGEGYRTVHPEFLKLKEKGLNPRSVTMDGHLHVIRAFRDVWPKLILQRCLYHIQRQGLSWLRTFPKTQAGQELRRLLLTVCQIHSVHDREVFVDAYQRWLRQHRDFVRSLPRTSVALRDLKRTMALLNHALPDMFHYLEDSRITPTTNKLESFYSRLKADFQRHRGLSESHKIAYLKWYCYYKNSLN